MIVSLLFSLAPGYPRGLSSLGSSMFYIILGLFLSIIFYGVIMYRRNVSVPVPAGKTTIF